MKTGFPVDRNKLEYLIDRLSYQEILIKVIRSCSAHYSMGSKNLALLVKPLPHHSFPAKWPVLVVGLIDFLKLLLLFPPEATINQRVFDYAGQWLRRHATRVESIVSLCWDDIQDLGLLLVNTSCDPVR